MTDTSTGGTLPGQMASMASSPQISSGPSRMELVPLANKPLLEKKATVYAEVVKNLNNARQQGLPFKVRLLSMLNLYNATFWKASKSLVWNIFYFNLMTFQLFQKYMLSSWQQSLVKLAMYQLFNTIYLAYYNWYLLCPLFKFFFGLYFINIYNSNMHWHMQSLVCLKKMLFYVFTICFVILSSLLPLLRALMKAWPLNHLVENQLTYRKYGTFFRFTVFSYLLNTCYSVTLFLHFHALYYITMQVWWSLNNFQTMMGEHATVQQTASRKMSLVIGARRHLEWGHEKYIMDTIQSHPAQVMVLF